MTNRLLTRAEAAAHRVGWCLITPPSFVGHWPGWDTPEVRPWHPYDVWWRVGQWIGARVE